MRRYLSESTQRLAVSMLSIVFYAGFSTAATDHRQELLEKLEVLESLEVVSDDSISRARRIVKSVRESELMSERTGSRLLEVLSESRVISDGRFQEIRTGQSKEEVYKAIRRMDIDALMINKRRPIIVSNSEDLPKLDGSNTIVVRTSATDPLQTLGFATATYQFDDDAVSSVEIVPDQRFIQDLAIDWTDRPRQWLAQSGSRDELNEILSYLLDDDLVTVSSPYRPSRIALKASYPVALKEADDWRARYVFGKGLGAANLTFIFRHDQLEEIHIDYVPYT